jgi:hypothetical protein
MLHSKTSVMHDCEATLKCCHWNWCKKTVSSGNTMLMLLMSITNWSKHQLNKTHNCWSHTFHIVVDIGSGSWAGVASGKRTTHHAGGHAGATNTLWTSVCIVSWWALLTVPCWGSVICITSVMETLRVISGTVMTKLTSGLCLLDSRCQLSMTIKIRLSGRM